MGLWLKSRENMVVDVVAWWGSWLEWTDLRMDWPLFRYSWGVLLGGGFQLKLVFDFGEMVGLFYLVDGEEM